MGVLCVESLRFPRLAQVTPRSHGCMWLGASETSRSLHGRVLPVGWPRRPWAESRGEDGLAGLGICIFNKPHVAILAYLCPWAAAWLNEFMSPCGVVEIPFLYMVPIRGSAPRSSSKLTSSKFPESPRGWHVRGRSSTAWQAHAGAQAGTAAYPRRPPAAGASQSSFLHRAPPSPPPWPRRPGAAGGKRSH